MTAVIITSNSKWAAQANIKCNDRLAQKNALYFLDEKCCIIIPISGQSYKRNSVLKKTKFPINGTFYLLITKFFVA